MFGTPTIAEEYYMYSYLYGKLKLCRFSLFLTESCRISRAVEVLLLMILNFWDRYTHETTALDFFSKVI